MTALVLREDLDFSGGFIVVAGILLIAAYVYADAWWATRKATPRRIDMPVIVRTTTAALVVHDQCTHDGCTNTICRCASGDGRACAGTRDPRCWHLDSTLCDEHPAGACCEIEARSEWGGVR